MTSKIDELREALFVNWVKIEGASSDTYNQHALLELDDLIAAVKAEERERCAKEVPTNYLDPLLSGESAVVKNIPASKRELEALLQGIQDRIRNLK